MSRSISEKAREFAVWRAGNSVKWRCTAREIAQELGMKHATVTDIMRRKGWKCEESSISESRAKRVGRFSVDTCMQSQYSAERD